MDTTLVILNALVVAVISLVVFMFVFMWIWNLVMPDVFGVKKITVWQALGIVILASILFGGHRVVNFYGYPMPHHTSMPEPL